MTTSPKPEDHEPQELLARESPLALMTTVAMAGFCVLAVAFGESLSSYSVAWLAFFVALAMQIWGKFVCEPREQEKKIAALKASASATSSRPR